MRLVGIWQKPDEALGIEIGLPLWQGTAKAVKKAETGCGVYQTSEASFTDPTMTSGSLEGRNQYLLNTVYYSYAGRAELVLPLRQQRHRTENIGSFE